MEKCNICNREFKSVSGLKIHLKTCMLQSNNDDNVLVSKTIDEVKEEVFELSIDVKRKIDKLRDSYYSTMDAEARHRIECEIKLLGGKLR